MAIEAAKAEPGLDSEVAPQMERQVGVGVTWKLVGQVGVQSIRLITVAVLARLLTPEDYGAAAVAIALAATFAPTVADMGVGSALVQTEQAPRLVRSTAFWSSIGFGLALFVLFAAAAGPIENFMGDSHVGTMVAAGGLTFAIYAIGATSQAVFMREMRFRDIELRNWLSLIVGAVVGIGAALAGAGAWALVAQQLALMATAGALWWGAGWRPAFEFSGVAFRSLVSFALRIVGGRWARLIELLVLSLMIGHYLGVAELGAWTFAMSMVILPLTLIAMPYAEVLFSAFSRLRNEPERIAALWLRSIAYLAAVLFRSCSG